MAAKKKTEVTEEAVVETEVETEEVKTEVKTEVKSEAESKPESLMYVGPTVPGIGIQNRVYTEIPDTALEAAKAEPEIRNLFISIPDYPEANRQLREQKGYVFSAYTKALKFKGGKKS